MINHEISDENYEHVLNIWETSKMITIKDYHDLHLKVDVLLSACAFQTFTKESINYFKLDPVHYLSIAEYSWDAMLRFTNLNLKLISVIGKYQLVESKRGGNSMICKTIMKLKINS